VHVTKPHLFHDEQRRGIPAVPRFILGRIGVSDFVSLVRSD
jgi:hypothetical protein